VVGAFGLAGGVGGEALFFGVEGVEDGSRGCDDGGEAVGGDEAEAAVGGVVDEADLGVDFGAGEPGDEGGRGGVVLVGDVAEGTGGVGEGVEDLGLLGGGGVEGGGEHGVIIRI
jgi:hypothetical protein